jgi:hypothetical protein
MIWPAVYNGYPLLYPDSMAYLRDGGGVAHALLRGPLPVSFWGRGFIYCLSILPLHWKITPWPVVGVNALVAAYVLWLVVRSIVPKRPVFAYLAVMTPLCLLTGVGWFVSYVMPDILGPLLYLSLYLMAFAWHRLRGAERWIIAMIAWWATVAHASHLLVAAGLWVAVAIVMVSQRQTVRRRVGSLSRMAAVLLLAALAQLALHGYLYGQPSLNGKRPPFLMARMIADGPARWYLQQNWGRAPLPNCPDAAHLPHSTTEFLWAANGVWQSASPQQQDDLRRREWPVVLGTCRAYPWAELALSAGHFWRQLNTFGLKDFAPNPWTQEVFDEVMPAGRAKYMRSRQAEGRLHESCFSAVQNWTVVVSLGMIIVAAVMLGRRWPRRLVGLTCVIGFAVIANAAVTGILSNVIDRYQGRVIWLVPFLAGMLVLAASTQVFVAKRRKVMHVGSGV